MRQVYLHSAVPLNRKIFLKNSSPEFEQYADHYVQLLKPLYRRCESGDLGHKIFDNHHRLELGMKKLHTDSALYFMMNENRLIGLSSSYLEDMI